MRSYKNKRLHQTTEAAVRDPTATLPRPMGRYLPVGNLVRWILQRVLTILVFFPRYDW